MDNSELRITLTLDEHRVPESIKWHSTTDSPELPVEQHAHALNVTLWNKDEAGTSKISLWTKDMPVQQMKRFYIDSIGAIAEDVSLATSDEVMAGKIHDLCQQLLTDLHKAGA